MVYDAYSSIPGFQKAMEKHQRINVYNNLGELPEQGIFTSVLALAQDDGPRMMA